MKLKHILPGNDVPNDINVVIEIGAQSLPVKYEVDKHTESLVVDRILNTSMFYPCNYGFIPHTLSEDGDPLDALVVTPFPLQPGCVINCRPIGLLNMTDEHGPDAKILTVPVEKITPLYKHILKPSDLGADVLDNITHFFTHYKDLEAGKWVKVGGWADMNAAKQEIIASVVRYDKKRHH